MSKQTEKIKKLEVGKYYQDENKNIHIRVDKEIEGEPWGSTIELWENSITIQTDYPLAKYIYSDECMETEQEEFDEALDVAIKHIKVIAKTIRK